MNINEPNQLNFINNYYTFNLEENNVQLQAHPVENRTVAKNIFDTIANLGHIFPEEPFVADEIKEAFEALRSRINDQLKASIYDPNQKKILQNKIEELRAKIYEEVSPLQLHRQNAVPEPLPNLPHPQQDQGVPPEQH
jgi:hypothetical protein